MRVTALDPQAAAVLARLAANGGRPLHEQTPAEARLGASGFLELFGPGEQVASVEHRFIPGPTADLPVRIYTPLTGCAPFPALVSFHGSGFVISNIGVFDAPNRALANRTGCIVVAVNYQKAPEHRFPVPFDDAYAATQWVFDHAAELGVDAGRIGVIGDRPALVRPAIPAHRRRAGRCQAFRRHDPRFLRHVGCARRGQRALRRHRCLRAHPGLTLLVLPAKFAVPHDEHSEYTAEPTLRS